VGAEAGVAYSADGREQAGMGIDSADYDHDGWPDIVKTISPTTQHLYHNDHDGEIGFDDVGPAVVVVVAESMPMPACSRPSRAVGDTGFSAHFGEIASAIVVVKQTGEESLATYRSRQPSRFIVQPQHASP